VPEVVAEALEVLEGSGEGDRKHYLIVIELQVQFIVHTRHSRARFIVLQKLLHLTSFSLFSLFPFPLFSLPVSSLLSPLFSSLLFSSLSPFSLSSLFSLLFSLPVFSLLKPCSK
jgi:hypothetical protein